MWRFKSKPKSTEESLEGTEDGSLGVLLRQSRHDKHMLELQAAQMEEFVEEIQAEADKGKTSLLSKIAGEHTYKMSLGMVCVCACVHAAAVATKANAPTHPQNCFNTYSGGSSVTSVTVV